MKYNTDDIRITGMQEVTAPEELLDEIPVDDTASRLVFDARQAISEVIHGASDRLLAVVGPCSIHDPDAAL